MKRVMVGLAAVLIAIALAASPAFCSWPGPAQGQGCAPQCTYVTKMVPCVKTQMVPEVIPCKTYIPVQKVGYRCQKILLKGTPVGAACGADGCTQCYPQPFCKVVTQKVPYTYCVPKCVTYYQVRYRKVCCPVMLPQKYMVQAIPLCY